MKPQSTLTSQPRPSFAQRMQAARTALAAMSAELAGMRTKLSEMKKSAAALQDEGARIKAAYTNLIDPGYSLALKQHSNGNLAPH